MHLVSAYSMARSRMRVRLTTCASSDSTYPEWELAARTDPDFTEAYNRIYELALGEGRHVSAKVREFVAIAVLAFRGADREGLVAHMRRAIRLGATREELFEVLEATLVPGGAPTFHRGLSALLEVE